MTIEQILATIMALQEAGTDEAVIKKMILAMLAEEAGAAVDMPASGEGVAMASEVPADQGAAPITSQPMQARNPSPQRPAAQRTASQPQRPALAAKPSPQPAAASYANQTKPKGNLQALMQLVGQAFAARDAASSPRPPAPAQYAQQPSPQRQAAPQAQPAEPMAYANETTVQEELLENALFTANERNGLHTGQSPEFLRKLLKSDPMLYAEAIGGTEPLTYQEGGSSPAVAVGARPLATTAGPMGERNALAKSVFAYRDAEVKAGRSCTFDQAMTKVLQTRGPSRGA